MNNINSSSPIRVMDEYYQDFPEDLYIPPKAFAILLEQFEGPLDFLLYLVQKSGFDLRSLDIAPIATQYIQYMDSMKALNIELTADYMVMAALLADLKSRLLLPKVENYPDFEDDPKKQLIDRLEQYLRIKHAAEHLGQRAVLDRDVFAAQVSLGQKGHVLQQFDVNHLHDALYLLLRRPQSVVHHITPEPVLLEERLAFICQQVAQGGVIHFEHLLLPQQGRMGIVVTFMAVLELIKQQHVAIVDDGSVQTLSIQGKHYATTVLS